MLSPHFAACARAGRQPGSRAAAHLGLLLVIGTAACSTRPPIARPAPSSPRNVIVDSANRRPNSVEPRRPTIVAKVVAEEPNRDTSATFSSEAPLVAPTSLTVRLFGAQERGTLRVALFKEAGSFPDTSRAVAVATTTAATPHVELVITDELPQQLAVAAFQDLNEDGELNKNLWGVPTEPYGFSNDARGRFGPPAFAAAAIDVATTEATTDIQLR